MLAEKTEYSVLMVDDEAQTLKYFRRAFDKEFQILTAASADEGMEILKEHSGRVAILISDQRMPDKRGVELLKYARREHPEVVRILTTGYTDLEEAIAAVNDGEIHRYITKPWDLSALQLELRQSMQFFLIRKERDELLNEKISAKQRLEGVVRVRELVAMASGFTATRHPVRAVQQFLEQIPVADAVDSDAVAAGWGRQLEQIERLSKALARMASELKERSEGASSVVELGDVLKKACSANSDGSAGFEIDSRDALSVEACPALLEWAFGGICAWVSATSPGKKITVEGKDQDGRIELSLLWEGGSWGQASLLDFPESLLGAYFAASHHSGDLHIGNQEDGKFGVRIALPKSAAESHEEAIDLSWLERALRRFENW